MGKRIIEVSLNRDGGPMVFVEVDDEDYADEDYYAGGDALEPISNKERRAWATGSVQAAIDDVIRPAVETIFNGLRRSAHAPDSVEFEFGLKLTGKLGAVFASTEAEGHVNVKMTWTHALPSASPAAESAPESAPE